MSWLVEMMGEGPARIAVWVFVILAGLVLLLFVIRLVRSLIPGTFVSGGRGRDQRLAVVDAAAVDARRRLVLVRRDQREHLLLIGGAGDVVVESGIGAESPPLAEAEDRTAAARAPETTAPVPDRPTPHRPPEPEPPPFRPLPVIQTGAPDMPRDAGTVPDSVAPRAKRVTPAPGPITPAIAQETATQVPDQAARPPPETMEMPAPAPERSAGFGPEHAAVPVEPLLEEPDVATEGAVPEPDEPAGPAPAPAAPPDRSLEEEMAQLLDDLSRERKI